MNTDDFVRRALRRCCFHMHLAGHRSGFYIVTACIIVVLYSAANKALLHTAGDIEVQTLQHVLRFSKFSFSVMLIDKEIITLSIYAGSQRQ